MPIYAYQCVSCGHGFDLKQGFDASTEAPCPNCEGSARRQFVAPTVIYKGSGFYTTDYARKGSGSSSNGASSPADSKSESKTESKGASSRSESSKSAGAASKTDSA